MTTYAKNKRARFDYEILETIEAGLVLSGQEVKAVRNNQMNLAGAFVVIEGNEAFLKQAQISAYKYAGILTDYDPKRTRKLLLSKREIAYLTGKSQEKGLTIIPISVYTKGRNIKLEIGIARGKKKHDKRQAIKKREIDREIRKAKLEN